MKLINIFSIICLVLVFVACSSEGDVLDDMSNNTSNGTTQVENKEVYLTFGLATKSMTKTDAIQKGSKKAQESEIKSCSVILLDNNDHVIVAMDNLTVENGKLKGANMLVKAQQGMKAIVVANTTEGFEGCNTRADVAMKVQSTTAFSENLVKYGESPITIPDSKATTGDATANPLPVEVLVNQLAARIELASVTIDENAFNGTLKDDIELVGVKLINRVKSCYTKAVNNEFGGNRDNASFSMQPVTLSASANWNESERPFFYTYPNKDENYLTSLELTFNVGGKVNTKIYTINKSDKFDHKYIKSGYLYRLNVKVSSLESNLFETTVTCEAAPWAVAFEGEVSMEEVK